MFSTDPRKSVSSLFEKDKIEHGESSQHTKHEATHCHDTEPGLDIVRWKSDGQIHHRDKFFVCCFPGKVSEWRKNEDMSLDGAICCWS